MLVGGSRRAEPTCRQPRAGFCPLRAELADIDATDYGEHLGLWTRGLLIRRNIADGELAYFTSWCPAGPQIGTLVRVEDHRWAIEDGFETATNELGLDHNETRSWHGWRRHVSLVILAFAMMAAIRHKAIRASPKKDADIVMLSIQEIRCSANRLALRHIESARIIAWSLWR